MLAFPKSALSTELEVGASAGEGGLLLDAGEDELGPADAASLEQGVLADFLNGPIAGQRAFQGTGRENGAVRASDGPAMRRGPRPWACPQAKLTLIAQGVQLGTRSAGTTRTIPLKFLYRSGSTSFREPFPAMAAQREPATAVGPAS